MIKAKKGSVVYYFTDYNFGGFVFFKVTDVTPTHVVARRLSKCRFDHMDSVSEGWVTRLWKVRPFEEYIGSTETKIRHEKYKIFDGKPLNERGKSFFNTALAPIK
jgi:hypothetical protein